MKHLLATSFVVLVATASPAPSLTAPQLSKRSNPVISPDLRDQFKGQTDRVTAQLKDAFQDACSMAKIARDHAKAEDDIFKKYFPTEDGTPENVLKIFDNIIGDDKSPYLQKKFEGVDKSLPDDHFQKDEPCADILKKYTVIPDFKLDNGFFHCDPRSVPGGNKDTTPQMAESLDCFEEDFYEHDKDPRIIVCNSGVAHGGVDKKFTTVQSTRAGTLELGPEAVTCKSISEDGDRVTWRMDTLGSIILHEYMHWAALTVEKRGPLSRDMSDTDENTGKDVYGPVLSQGRKKDNASQTFPDIYTWFALEAFWSKKCDKTYALAEKDKKDGEDPRCDNKECQDPGSNPPKKASK